MNLSPLEINKINEAKIETRFLGYYLKWIPQENFYYVENTGFEVNNKRIDGTYQKYASIDDKIDGFFYYILHQIWLWKSNVRLYDGSKKWTYHKRGGFRLNKTI